MLEDKILGGVRIVKMMLTLDADRHIDRVKIASALQSLRQLFFFPSELIFTLELASDGKVIDGDVLQYYAEEFRLVPASIQQAFDFMNLDRFEAAELLTTREMSSMQDIRFGKLNLRRDIHEFFSSYHTAQIQGNNTTNISREAARILGQIERFNKLVQSLEDKFIAARNQQPARTRTPARRSAARPRARQSDE